MAFLMKVSMYGMRVMLILAMLMLCKGDIVVKPVPTFVTTGETVILNCSTSWSAFDTNWYKYVHYFYKISNNGIILIERFVDRYSIVGNTSNGEYNLKIENVNDHDMGEYRCAETRGDGYYHVRHADTHLAILKYGPYIYIANISYPPHCIELKASFGYYAGHNHILHGKWHITFINGSESNHTISKDHNYLITHSTINVTTIKFQICSNKTCFPKLYDAYPRNGDIRTTIAAKQKLNSPSQSFSTRSTTVTTTTVTTKTKPEVNYVKSATTTTVATTLKIWIILLFMALV